MKKLLEFLTLGAVMMSFVGCSSIGNAPSGMSEDDAKDWINSQPPEEQIKMIQTSPMSPADKEKRIKEIRGKHGLSEDAAAPDTGGAPVLPGR
jgi:hypothetical protein